jgi:hypothetical protein
MANVTAVLYPFADKAFLGTTWAEHQWRWLLDAFGMPWLFVAFYLSMTACYISAGAVFW